MNIAFIKWPSLPTWVISLLMILVSRPQMGIISIIVFVLCLPSFLGKKSSILFTAACGLQACLTLLLPANTFINRSPLSILPAITLLVALILNVLNKKELAMLPIFALGVLTAVLSSALWEPSLYTFGLFLCCWMLSKKADLPTLLIAVAGAAYAIVRILVNYGSWEMIKFHVPVIILLYALLMFLANGKTKQPIAAKLWWVPMAFSLMLLLGNSSSFEHIFTIYSSAWTIIWILSSDFTKVVTLGDIKANFALPEKFKKHIDAINAPVQSPIPMDQIPEIDDLSQSILQALRPKLKTPLTAVLCQNNELEITEKDDTYTVSGQIHSQNSYGAMIATDFIVFATFENDIWRIHKTQLGVKNARNYAKNFIINYILLSIFVAIMAAIGYWILSMYFGF